MIARLNQTLSRFGDLVFPLPTPEKLKREYAAHAEREALSLWVQAEALEVQAAKARLEANMLRSRAAKLRSGAWGEA